MPLPSNPQTLANYDITKGDQAKIFVKKVSDLFLSIAQTLTPAGLAAILNGNGLIQGTALTLVSTELGNVSVDQTVNCAGASAVTVFANNTAASTRTLTLNNLTIGVPVTLSLANTSGGSQLWMVKANTPASVAYAVTVGINSVSTSLSGAGFSVANNGRLNTCGNSAPTTLRMVGG